ncbi:MAG: HDOD domain-containing protein [Solirubrobacteraceae bacterium]|jgi:diguanylate cyclase (GGDEF)-like protein/putative nucleotidyltransferase with HDIG domain
MFDSALAAALPPDPRQSRALVAAVGHVGELPVVDRTVQRVLSLCRDEDSSTPELIAVLENDAPFAANLLRFANSAYVARPVPVRTIRQAVMMAGRERIGRLALETVTCRFLERARGNGRASAGLMQVHASAVASCALELAQRSGAATDVAHLAGLLHDIGKLVMPLAFGEQALDEIAGQAPAGHARVALERDRYGCDHALAGAMLANASGIDAPVVTAILTHHDPEAPPSAETACVQVANALVGMLMGTDPDPALLDQALSALGLTAAVLDDLVAHAGQLGAGAASGPHGGEGLATRIAALERQANIDELTGLANRRHWRERAGALVGGRPGAVMLCDIDHFKQVNDRNGHATGDLVLSEIARILSHHGLAGRLGGDELVLLVTAPRDKAGAIAEAILREVRDAFPTGTIRGWNGGLSIGVALAGPDAIDISALLTTADDALYEAKRAGRGRAVVAG